MMHNNILLYIFTSPEIRINAVEKIFTIKRLSLTTENNYC